VTLNWTASTSAVTSYNIYRKKQGENAFTRIASVSANSPNPTSYTDTAVAFGDSLHYYVTSVDSNNVESVPSNVVDTGLA
jgi:fibronectin type 3 domain-containing protein